jgi:hypothetical protein
MQELATDALFLWWALCSDALLVDLKSSETLKGVLRPVRTR